MGVCVWGVNDVEKVGLHGENGTVTVTVNNFTTPIADSRRRRRRECVSDVGDGCVEV